MQRALKLVLVLGILLGLFGQTVALAAGPVPATFVAVPSSRLTETAVQNAE